jgi:hypothetical protein
MNDELKKAIERLRESVVASRIKGNNLQHDADILAVCDCAEKAMRVVEAAKDFYESSRWLICNDEELAQQEMREKRLRLALAAMEEP